MYEIREATECTCESTQDDEVYTGKKIDFTIMQSDYHLEIVRVSGVIENFDISQSCKTTECTFVRVEGRTILSVDIRKEPEKADNKRVTLVLTEVWRNRYIMPMGFIVESKEDFYRRCC